MADSAYVRVLDLASDDNLIVTNPFGYFKALGVVILLATVILGGLATISTGVVEEKSSRVVEIILTSVKPRTLLLGKILGIGTVVIGQVACYIVVAFISLKIAGVPLPLLNLSSLAVWTILWSIVGFFTFSLIAGALAATVSRQEDLAPITSTLTMLTFIPIYGGFFLISAMPDATITKVLSYIPFMSSFMMPIRQSFGISSPTEQIIAFALGLQLFHCWQHSPASFTAIQFCIPVSACLSGRRGSKVSRITRTNEAVASYRRLLHHFLPH